MKTDNPKSCSALALLVLFMGLTTAHAEKTYFVDVHVVTMERDAIVRHQTIVVDDGAIIDMGPAGSVAVESEANVVDGAGRYLMPGLAEMHAHVTNVRDFDRLATLFVANGVTTIRGMLGRQSHLQLRQDIASGAVFGPRLITSGPSLNGQSVSGPTDAASTVVAQHDVGFDFVKIHPGLSAAEFLAAADQARQIGMPIAGHVPADVGIEAALDSGMATIDHLDSYFAGMLPGQSTQGAASGGFFGVRLADRIDPSKIDELAVATASAGVWNVATQILVEQVIDDTPVDEFKRRHEMRFVAAQTFKSWVNRKASQSQSRDFDPDTMARAVELRRQLILALHRAGAGLLLGSDAPQIFNVPGYSTHRELGVLVDAGLSPFEALQTGTTKVAEFLGENSGHIAVGAPADLVLLRENPLVDIKNTSEIEGVMLGGEWFDRCRLDRMLARYVVQSDDRMGVQTRRPHETCTASARRKGSGSNDDQS